MNQKKSSLLISFLVLYTVIFSFNGRCLAAGDRIMPSWNIGDSWTVQAHYLQDSGRERWSEPVLWTYTVSDLAPLDNDTSLMCYVLEVVDKSGSSGITAKLWYQKESYSLRKAELVGVKHGNRTVKTLYFAENMPVSTSRTLIPFDTPVFPLRPGGEAITGTFSSEIDADLKVRKRFQQVVETAVDIPEDIRNQNPENTFLVTCHVQGAEKLFEQFWVSEKPWPIFGINHQSKYILLENK
jgi:hypothetical protein